MANEQQEIKIKRAVVFVLVPQRQQRGQNIKGIITEKKKTPAAQKHRGADE